MASFDTAVDYAETRATQINLIGWIFTGVAIASVTLKLFTRVEIVQKLDWDDFFIFFSMALSIIATAFVSYSVTLGLGRHTAAVVAEHGMQRYVDTAYWQIIAFPFNIGAFSFPNISIAILINRLLNPSPLRTQLLYAMVTFQVIIAMISVCLVFLQCSPTKMLWDPTAAGTCWSSSVFDGFTYWVSAYTAVTDIVLAIVPISVFWKLQMPLSTKIGVCIMMSLTMVSAIVTIVKATYLYLFTDHTDPLWKVVPLVSWGLIEQNVVIVAACIPTLRPFFRSTFKSSKISTEESAGVLNSGPSFQKSSKRAKFVSELALNDLNPNADDKISIHSRKGGLRAREACADSDEDSFFDSGHRRQNL